VDPRTGEQIVTVNGVSTTFPPGYAITVRAGQGNDTVDVAPGMPVRLTLLGGEGDDTLRGGDGSDRILGLDGRDTVDGRGGDDRITLGASRTHLPGEDLRTPVIERADGGAGRDAMDGSRGADSMLGGDGDDRLEAGAGDDTVDGGGGNDVVRGGADTDNAYGREGDDVVDGGAGRDYVDGGAGADRLTGGLGDDTVYGLSGADTVDGGAGQDYLEGGADNDTITGGAGDDMISGGRGDDTVTAGGGNDRIYTGPGRDTVAAGGGGDQVYAQAEDTVTGAERTLHVEVSDQARFIRIEGSPEFVERVQADLDMLRASPTGQQMLGNLERAHEDSRHWFYDGDGLTIRELRDENGHANVDESLFGAHEQWNIEYNPSFDTLHDGPPVVVLYHEMAHVYDYANDTLAEGVYTGPDNPNVNNRERVAAGLPIDHDDDPSTPIRIDPRHPYQYTENGLREELGAPHRPSY
jgi:Ca2+-binding RTX toxin-like protein